MMTMHGVFARTSAKSSSKNRIAIRTGRWSPRERARARRPRHAAFAIAHKAPPHRPRARRFVGVYGGTVLRREQTLSEAQTNQQYLFDLNEHITIDGSLGGNVTRYM